MGVSGSGKTTIGKMLAHSIDVPFYDGDDFHPQSNIEKMRSGRPLNDRDRQGWLEALNKLALKTTKNKGAIIACSALKEDYRIILNKGLDPKPEWIFLNGDQKLIMERMQKREAHFMAPDMLQSQFDTLENPSDMFSVSIDTNPEEIVDKIITYLK